MAGGGSSALTELKTRPGHNTWGAAVARTFFIIASLFFLAALLIAPLITVFGTALSAGVAEYFHSFADPDTQDAIRLTLLVAAIVLPLNTIFGIAASWAIAKFEFKGKSMLVTLIDLPIAVSPVIAGLIYVLVYGVNGWFGPWLVEHDGHLVRYLSVRCT
jgi:sulfate/thiosulfate transport system permease protein